MTRTVTLTPAGYVLVEDDPQLENAPGRVALTDAGYVVRHESPVNAHQLYLDQVDIRTTTKATLTPLGYVACDTAWNVNVPGFDRAPDVGEELKNAVTLAKIRGWLPPDFPA